MNNRFFYWFFVLLSSSLLYYLSFQELLESRKLWENQGLGNEGMSRVNAFFHYKYFFGIMGAGAIQVIFCLFSWRFRYKFITVFAIPLIFYFITVWSTKMVQESLVGIAGVSDWILAADFFPLKC
jgi:hypothetical protein